MFSDWEVQLAANKEPVRLSGRVYTKEEEVTHIEGNVTMLISSLAMMMALLPMQEDGKVAAH